MIPSLRSRFSAGSAANRSSCRRDPRFPFAILVAVGVATGNSLGEPKPVSQLSPAGTSAIWPLPERTQPFRLTLHEKRTTRQADVAPVEHELTLTLVGTVTPIETGNPESKLRLSVDKFDVRFTSSSPTPLAFAARWQKDQPDRVKPLPDWLTPLAGAEVLLHFDADRVLVDVVGLDARWARAGKLFPPPRLALIHQYFRDATFHDLLVETLFPPPDARAWTTGERDPAEVRADLPGVARLIATLTPGSARFSEPDRLPDRGTTHLRAEGPITTAPPIIADSPPALRVQVLQGRQNIDWYVAPAPPAIRSTSHRRLQLRVTLTPPTNTNADRLTTDIEQHRTLEAGWSTTVR